MAAHRVVRLGSTQGVGFAFSRMRGLTLHSTGPSTAGRLGPAVGTQYIFYIRAKPSRRSGPVSSTLGSATGRLALLQQNQRLSAWAEQPRDGKTSNSQPREDASRTSGKCEKQELHGIGVAAQEKQCFVKESAQEKYMT